MTKTLQSLMPLKPVTIAKLAGLKSIVRVDSARKSEWWLVLPAVGEGDCPCILIRSLKCGSSRMSHRASWVAADNAAVIAEYADRIASTN